MAMGAMAAFVAAVASQADIWFLVRTWAVPTDGLGLSSLSDVAKTVKQEGNSLSDLRRMSIW